MRRSTIVKIGVLAALALLVAGSGPAHTGPWWARYYYVDIIAAYAFFVALAVVVVFAFTRLDRLRLAAAVALLSSLSAFVLVPVPRFLIASVQLHHQKAQVGSAISDFVQRHGRVPANLRELYPDGDAPSFAETVFFAPEEGFSFPETVVLKDLRLSSSAGPYWRYDHVTRSWTTNPRIAEFLREHLLERVSNPVTLIPMLFGALLSLAAAYRPWRRLGEQQRASIKPEET